MPAGTFDAFRAELEALKELVSKTGRKTVRDERVRDRFRMLFRMWVWTVKPTIAPLVESRQNLLKLEAELEALATLTVKWKPVAEYRKRLNRAITFAHDLVLHLPPTDTAEHRSLASSRRDLFLPRIPDLPAGLVPNALLGWRSQMDAFVNKYGFDKCVFIMIRYRDRNTPLVKAIKKVLSAHDYKAILASEHRVTDDLYNATACLLCCSRGIAVFDEAEAAQEFNPNVAYELGMLHLLGRECLILKHENLNALQTDLLMKLYNEYHTPEDVAQQTLCWVEALESGPAEGG